MKKYGQRVRRESTLNEIFDLAGLIKYKESRLEQLHKDYHPLKVWILCPKDDMIDQ